MRNEVFEIKAPGSLPGARLTTYLQEHYEEIKIAERPLVLICPGGAYAYTSPREGEAFAMQFLAFQNLLGEREEELAPSLSLVHTWIESRYEENL